MDKLSHTVKKKSGTVNARHTQASGSPGSKVSAARQASLKTLKLVYDGQSLSVAQKKLLDNLDDQRDRGLANEIVNGVLRWRWQLAFILSQLLSKPLKAKDIDVQLILQMALYEIIECRTPDYAIINEAVELVRKSKKKWAASLVNAVLRNFTRNKEQILASVNNAGENYSHPEWIIKKIKEDWPDRWQAILNANNQRPAFWLRVNQSQTKLPEYQQLLSDAGIEAVASSLTGHALKLSQGIDVQRLPYFVQGVVSVQDVGAQLAADLLNVSADQRVLDLCAAPGGKTCHILESCNTIKQMVAVELEESRMQRVRENLQRLKFDDVDVALIVADACDYKEWWQGNLFDRILVDAPCSASGVIRRHPDIKTLRRESDIEHLVKVQSEILSSAWRMLSEGGELLYVTCSVFKDENERQIENFFSKNKNVAEIKIMADWGEACQYGRQLFPGEQDADGFYFCRLTKIAGEKLAL